VNGGPIVELAVGSMASFGALNLHIGGVLLQGLRSKVFVPVGVVELDRGSAHVVFLHFGFSLPFLFFMFFIVLIVV
jgi:hypothetical protein